ncbi:MAG: VOC family protein [Verrucomicrobiota bacterium]
MPSPAPSLTLGYVILYVQDVAASLAFYEEAFGFSRRFFHDDNGKAYGELETGATRLSFVSLALAKETLKVAPTAASRTAPPQASEIALVTPEVKTAYDHAVAAGALAVAAPVAKPWGQIVACVRDPDGHLVELCSPLS